MIEFHTVTERIFRTVYSDFLNDGNIRCLMRHMYVLRKPISVIVPKT